ncbi:MAG: glycerophosphodiester phosphodiesterase [Clostridia bacterium]|nr:glycerophosphodiester phosphodiesterase [Clostridia bacterium]
MDISNIARKAVKAGCIAAGLGALLVAPGQVSEVQKAPFKGRNFAHRGLHTEDGMIPENSLEAFRRAVSAGYGIELDVQLSSDGRVMVFHDDDLDRVCGVSGKIWDRTYRELREMRLNGTDSVIPTLHEVLETVKGKVPLIVELKTGPRNKELCKKTCAILTAYKGDFCIESFNPLIVGWFRMNAPEILRGQLATVTAEYGAKTPKPVAFALSNGLTNIIARPQFIAYSLHDRPLGIRVSEMMGAMRVGWTSHGEENEKGRDAVIFEFYRPKTHYRK